MFQHFKAYFFDKIGYEPHKLQRELHLSQVRYKVFVAGARSGKSMAAGVDTAPYLLLPGYAAWCVSSTYKLAEKEFEWCKWALNRFIFNGFPLLSWAKVSEPSKGSRSITFPWGSSITTMSTMKKESMLGAEIDRAIVGEAGTVDTEAWNRILFMRLGSRIGDAIFPTTGAGDYGLLNYCKEKAENKKETDWVMWQFATLENPTYSRAEYDKARESLTAELFSEGYEGQIVSRRGLVFKSFCNDNICNELPSDFEKWARLVGVVRGYNNPLVMVWVAYKPTGEFLVYDEFHKREALWTELLPKWNKLRRGIKVPACMYEVHDKACMEALKEIGIPAYRLEAEVKMNEKAAVMKRVQLMQNMLKVPEKGRPRLRIMSHCENAIIDFGKCKWPDRKREDQEIRELEIPLSKYFQVIRAISMPVALWEKSAGTNIYEVQ